MTNRTESGLTGMPTSELGTLRAEHRQRDDNEFCTDGAAADPLTERVEALGRRVRHPGQNYASAVSSYEGPPSVGGSFDDEGDEVERELPWVAVLPECDRKLFAEEMAQLMAEAAQTDDFADVEQALREWRVTSEIYLDPELAKRLAGPRLAYGERVPRPVV